MQTSDLVYHKLITFDLTFFSSFFIQLFSQRHNVYFCSQNMNHTLNLVTDRNLYSLFSLRLLKCHSMPCKVLLCRWWESSNNSNLKVSLTFYKRRFSLYCWILNMVECLILCCDSSAKNMVEFLIYGQLFYNMHYVDWSIYLRINRIVSISCV